MKKSNNSKDPINSADTAAKHLTFAPSKSGESFANKVKKTLSSISTTKVYSVKERRNL